MEVHEGVSPICSYFGQFDVNFQEGVLSFCRYFSQFEVICLKESDSVAGTSDSVRFGLFLGG